ncbi:MAG: tripartite tricarboxylate transporter substrate binding protein [Proteobacteria bacterium]|nr:tripartite tricarboxylate transporter substrate binding protein [Pseudomonadota bacterium]
MTSSTMPPRRAARRRLLALTGAAVVARAARAQDAWPARPLRIVQAGAPGGGSEMMVRAIEPRLAERLHQPLVIESRPGAGGMVAAGLVATAAPDGYTYFVSNLATNGIAPSLYRKPSFDPRRDLPGVALIATMSNAVAVRADGGLRSVAELAAYIKANPKKAFYGSAGAGTSSHLCGVLLGQRAGFEASHVPYKGTAANLNALLAGEVLFSIDNVPLYAPHVKAGTLRLLAVTRATRIDSFPDVPTLAEAGVRDFDVSSWYGLSAATGTPPAIIQRLGAEVVAALADPAIQARIRSLGAEPAPMGPEAYSAFMRSELERWAPVVKASGAVLD